MSPMRGRRGWVFSYERGTPVNADAYRGGQVVGYYHANAVHDSSLSPVAKRIADKIHETVKERSKHEVLRPHPLKLVGGRGAPAPPFHHTGGVGGGQTVVCRVVRMDGV